jgi:uncharacterized protein
MLSQLNSYLSPRCESRIRPDGERGAFALEPITRGDLIAVFGGDVHDWESLQRLSPATRSLSLQVADELFLVSVKPGAGDYLNHSCNPNAGLSGQICLVAMRDISAGEEICFDYATCDSLPYDEFSCSCGEPNCRGHVTGDDWKIKELQERYAGYFSPYLQKRIDLLNTRLPHKGRYPAEPAYTGTQQP